MFVFSLGAVTIFLDDFKFVVVQRAPTPCSGSTTAPTTSQSNTNIPQSNSTTQPQSNPTTQPGNTNTQPSKTTAQPQGSSASVSICCYLTIHPLKKCVYIYLLLLVPLLNFESKYVDVHVRVRRRVCVRTSSDSHAV